MVTYAGRKKRGAAAGPRMSDAEFVAAARAAAQASYREQSLRIHGWVCGKCGREFDVANLHLLTVHHRDGNHHNNPPDGSNWENLCAYCHEDEHAREVLAGRLADGRGEDGGTGSRGAEPARPPGSAGFGTLGELLAAKRAPRT
jgi:hypothetical protein